METSQLFGTEKISKILLKMAPPVMLAQLIQALYNIIDSLFVGRYSDSGLTALSIIYPIQLLMIALAVGTGVGINTVMASKLGIGRKKAAEEYAGTGTLLAVVMWFLFALIGFAIMPFYARMSTDSPEVIADIIVYGRIVCVFSFGLFLESIWTKVLQAEGNMKTPMVAQIAGAVTNILLDPLLIFGIFGLPEMGIAGAAVSTVGGYTLSMILAFFVLFGTKQKVKVRRPLFSPKINLQIMRAGLPSFIMNALGAVMVLFTNQFLILCSTTAVAFFGAYFKIQQLIVMTVNGLIQGCLPIMSYNYGAKKFDRLREAFQKGTFIATFLMTASSLALFFVPQPILRLFDASPELNAIGIPAMKIMGFGFAFNALSTMMATCLQAMNRIKDSLLINLMRQLLVLLPAMFILFRIFGQTGVWLAFPVCEIVTFIVALILFRRQKFTA